MFSSNNAEILKFQKQPEAPDVLKTILSVHKKLKDIAKGEFNPKPRYTVAKLTEAELQKIKNYELSLNCCLVAYMSDETIKCEKLNILNKINHLLNQYSNLAETSKNKNLTEDFKKFFEQ